MIRDIVTILWKELKEILYQRGRLRGGWVGLLIIVGVFGVFMPLQSGPEWVESPLPLILWSWVPFVLVGGVIADSFAGERERHTLETLLASRLSDQTILFGKIISAIIYGWSLALVCALLSLVSINAAYGKGNIIWYPPLTAIAIPIFSFLIAATASGLGVLISLRSASVRQAQQTFSLAYFLLFVPVFVVPILPEKIKATFLTWLVNANFTQIGIAVALILILVNIGLISVAMMRFKRNQLILD